MQADTLPSEPPRGNHNIWHILSKTWVNINNINVVSVRANRDTKEFHFMYYEKQMCTGKTQRDGMEREAGGGDQDGEHM